MKRVYTYCNSLRCFIFSIILVILMLANSKLALSKSNLKIFEEEIWGNGVWPVMYMYYDMLRREEALLLVTLHYRN